eukprot:5693486-Pyramimonas_sp.AAC.1
MHRVCDANSPRPDGRVERHGGWIRERIKAEVESGSALPGNQSEPEDLVYELCAHKNRFWYRGGFPPLQLALEENPRLPDELLSDDGLGLPGWQDAIRPASEQDSAGA